MCYIFSTMAAKKRRSGTTETFSVSVDRDTKDALRLLADREFGGNLSALIADFAEEARRRKAAGDFLRRHGVPPLTKHDALKLEAEIAAESRTLAPTRKHPRRRKVA